MLFKLDKVIYILLNQYALNNIYVARNEKRNLKNMYPLYDNNLIYLFIITPKLKLFF